MKKEFVLNLVFLILINLMIKPLYIFGIDVGVQNAAGPEAYGLYFYLLGFVYLFQVINDLGIQNFNNRFISLNEHLLTKYFPHIFSLKLVLGVSFLVIVSAFGLALGLMQLYPLLFGIIALNLILDSLNGYLRSNIAGMAWYRTDSLLSVADKIVMILLVGFLLLNHSEGSEFPIIWFALSQTASFLTVSLICLFLLRNRYSGMTAWPKKKYFLLIFRKSWPFALILLSTFIYNRLDGVMIGYLLEDGEREAGYYAAGFRLYDAASMFTFLFVGLLYPMFSKMLSRGEDPAPLYILGLKLMWVTVLAVLLVLLTFSDEIMHGLYTDPGPDAGSVLFLLALAFAAKSIFHISGSFMLSYGDLKRINIIFAAGMLLNFLLNWWLIPKYGILGACLATLSTQALVAIALFKCTIQQSGGKANLFILLKGIALLSGLLIALYTFSELNLDKVAFRLFFVAGGWVILGLWLLNNFRKKRDFFIKRFGA